jgi:methyl coenzyme M reductase subunit C
LNVVDIDAKLTIGIKVENYEQVVKKDKGRLLGTVTKVPGANSFVKGKVDETIEKEVKGNLEQTLPEKLAAELTKGLREQGVQASVDVSLAFQE